MNIFELCSFSTFSHAIKNQRKRFKNLMEQFTDLFEQINFDEIFANCHYLKCHVMCQVVDLFNLLKNVLCR